MTTDSKHSDLISVEINAASSQRYKSILNLIWKDIPQFAILTGRNGAGKSQLLELLAYQLTGTRHPLGDLSYMTVNVTGDAYQPDDVAYVPISGQFAHGATLTVAAIQEAKHNLFQQIQHLHQVQGDLRLRTKRARVEKLIGRPLNGLSIQEFERLLPDDFVYLLEDNDVITGLAHVILAYRLQALQELENGKTPEEIKENLGPAPWDALNDSLGVAGFPYKVVSPAGSNLFKPYNFQLIDINTQNSIQPGDLSSGEKVLLQLILWLYNSKHHNRFPRLMLLDEPDAHLHPSMTRQFMDVVQQVLVERFNVRVIMTTHSPSTVALAPEGSLFQMERGQPIIRPSASKSDAVGLLTAGLVIVSPTTRYVLVEDEVDVNFYCMIRGILSDYGPSKDMMALDPSPSIVFLPASIGQGANKIGGGKGAVTGWVARLDTPPFDQIVRGVIDRDSGNASAARIFTLSRYSIENYLVDPFVVFGLLSESGCAPIPIVSSGDEHLIRNLDESDLQEILNAIRRKIEPELPDLFPSEGEQIVEFTNGRRVKYANWMIERRGHDLLPIFQSVFGGPKLLSPPRLISSLKRVRLIPKELAELMTRLQKEN